MGDNTQAAKEFAETVQSKMGIDSKEWMNYQAIFQNLATGFGVANDSASVMSKNLTQLSYDLSSIYNTDVEKAFDKSVACASPDDQSTNQDEYDFNNNKGYIHVVFSFC